MELYATLRATMFTTNFIRILNLPLCFLLAACAAPSTEERTVRQGNEKVEKTCTEKPPGYTNQVEARLRAALPLETKSEAQAEGLVRQYLAEIPRGTDRGEDLKSYLFYICQMSNNGSWSPELTERLINLFLDKWPTQGRNAAILQHSQCIDRLQQGYTIKEGVDSEYWTSVKKGTFQDQQEEYIARWNNKAGDWVKETERVLLQIGGPLAKGRFQNALIPSTAIDNTNYKWNGIRNFLQGKLLALESACGQIVGHGISPELEDPTIKNLQRQAFDLVQDLRKFQLERNRAGARIDELYDMHRPRTEDEAYHVFAARTRDHRDLHSQQEKEFAPMRIRAIVLRDNILKHLPTGTTSHMVDKSAEFTLEMGGLSGPSPAGDLADYLERLALLLKRS